MIDGGGRRRSSRGMGEREHLLWRNIFVDNGINIILFVLKIRDGEIITAVGFC